MKQFRGRQLAGVNGTCCRANACHLKSRSHIAGAGKAFGDGHFHGAQDHPLNFRRNGRLDLAERAERPRIGDAPGDGGWRLAGQQVIQRRAERIEIGTRFGVTQFRIILFGRRVLRRAQTAHGGRRLGAGRVEDLDQTKIDEEYLTLGGNTDVGGFYIAMNEAMLMDVLQGRQRVDRPSRGR